MTFGGEPGRGADEAESRKIFEHFCEAGGNFIDTAVNYAGGKSEEIVGKLVAKERDRFVISTKYTAPIRPGDPNSGGNHRKSLRQALDLSLRRLRTDHVDIYWVHVWEQMTPMDEILRALDDAVTAGKVLYTGISDAPAWVVSRANALAELRGRTPFSAIQVEYNLTQRTVERELVPMAHELDLAVLAWGPLARGLLSGKYNGRQSSAGPTRLRPGDERLDDRRLAVAAEVTAVAAGIGATPAQVALAWLRQRRGVVVPIVGARTAGQIEDSLGCLDLTLDTVALERLDTISQIELGFPHDFLASMRRSSYANASAAGQVANHRR
jgi:aryl-alcohol dehydrogenase-like predicted oxidoreductase